ncbi:phosphatidylinositol N-acetylglucosaminyltransferase subunit Q-like [Haliotis cracherodii]|uniref:phosphatidylinositol N-acetylglucosaminyltransferase subunit Q-like n=1 Tax=Haliotis cracherodii TaxID=6455 RepID=UPI0039E7F894
MKISLSNMPEKQLWKVFLPSGMLTCPSGYIYGSVLERTQTVCIQKISESENDSQNSSVVGIWRSCKEKKTSESLEEIKTISHGDIFIKLCISEFGSISCSLQNLAKKHLESKCHCILYDPCDLLSSYILTNRSFISQTTTFNTSNEVVSSCENISSLVSSLLTFSNIPGENYEAKGRKEVKEISRISTRGIFYPFCQLMICPFISIFLLFGKIFDNRCTKSSLAKTCLDGPTLTRHIRYKCSFLRRSCTQKNDSPLNRLKFLDSCGRQLIDTALGICVMVVMVNATLADTAATSIMDWADNVASSLTRLINWMMGAPAGLKLNTQLTHFLGHFFLYHIYLWTGYLSLLRPVLGVLLRGSSVLGVIGASAQLCLVQDVISMMTVHIYCFYVYAARLYSLQVYALASLWRLFRGKKWNVLRHRVDSAVYDIDQLFVGTLFFTILLFLLPTTLLYYVFFLALRAVVLVTEGLLTLCVWVINHLPVYSITMWLLGSNTVAGDVRFSVVPDSFTETSLVLTMQPSHLPLCELLKSVKVTPTHTQPSDSLATLLHKVIKGQLIYPWIDEKSSSDKKNV